MGIAVGATALFMELVIPASGWLERAVIGLFGGLFLVDLIKGILHIRAGRVELHREWMIRAFAVGLAIATTRLISIPALLIVGMQISGVTLVIVSFTIAFVMHASVAGAWIRATLRSHVSETGEVKAV